jgi:hypothetical protein
VDVSEWHRSVQLKHPLQWLVAEATKNAPPQIRRTQDFHDAKVRRGFQGKVNDQFSSLNDQMNNIGQEILQQVSSPRQRYLYRVLLFEFYLS